MPEVSLSSLHRPACVTASLLRAHATCFWFLSPTMRRCRVFDVCCLRQNKTGEGHIGSGGMADTRDPAPVDHADPRKSISAAPSFAEYLKSKRN